MIAGNRSRVVDGFCYISTHSVTYRANLWMCHITNGMKSVR